MSKQRPDNPRDRSRHRSTPWIAALFVGVALVAFGPALGAPFDFDDLETIEHNVSIRVLWPPSVPLSPPGLGTAVAGRPISNYSFALSYAINRWLGIAQAPASNAPSASIGFHLANILLHVAVALLLFGIVRDVIRFGDVEHDWRNAADRIALTVAGLWLVHPMQTEAVNYVSQRTEILVSFWYLLTLYAAFRSWQASQHSRNDPSRSTRVIVWAGVSVVACLLGMGTKEVMLTAPLVVLLFDRAFLFPNWSEMWNTRARRWLYVGLFATMIWSIALIARGARTATVGFNLRIPWYQYLYSQAWAISHYLTLVIWPRGLTYDYGQDPVRDWSGIPGLVGLVLLAGLTVSAWRNPKRRGLAFLGAWFFLLLAPSSSVVPIQTEIAAERRMYLALAAVIVAAVVGVEAAWRRVARDRRTTRPVARSWTLGAAAIAGILIAVSFARSRLYVDPERLWRDAVTKRPANPRALNGLAVAELRNRPHELKEPDSLLSHALVLDSTYLPAWISKSAIAISESRFGDAERFLDRALRLAPEDSAATDKLGRVLLANGRPDRAIPYLQRMTRWRPSGETLTILGVAYLSSGKLDSATDVLEQALQREPANTETMLDLGGALIEQDRGSEAVPLLTQVVARDTAAAPLAMLSLAYAQARHPEFAARAAEAAIARAPNEPAVYQFVGRAAQTLGRFDDAAKYLSLALRLDPNDPQTLTRLGIAEASLGRTVEATAHLERALALAPGYARAQHALDDLKMKRSR